MSIIGGPFGYFDTSGFGTLNGLTLEQRIAAANGKQTATAKGDTFLANMYEGILKYGLPLVTSLVSAGVFKNKTQIEIAKVQANALATFQSQNTGVNLATTDPALLRGANNNPFGISTSNLLLIGGGILAYMALSKK